MWLFSARGQMNPVNQIINQITSLFGCTPFCGSLSTPREWKLTVLKGIYNADKSSSPMPSAPISLCSSARATGTHWWFHGQTRPSELVPRTWEYAPLPHSSLWTETASPNTMACAFPLCLSLTHYHDLIHPFSYLCLLSLPQENGSFMREEVFR